MAWEIHGNNAQLVIMADNHGDPRLAAVKTLDEAVGLMTPSMPPTDTEVAALSGGPYAGASAWAVVMCAVGGLAVIGYGIRRRRAAKTGTNRDTTEGSDSLPSRRQLSAGIVLGVALTMGSSSLSVFPARAESPTVASATTQASTDTLDAIRFRNDFAMRCDVAYVELAARDAVGLPDDTWACPSLLKRQLLWQGESRWPGQSDRRRTGRLARWNTPEYILTSTPRGCVVLAKRAAFRGLPGMGRSDARPHCRCELRPAGDAPRP